VHTHMKYKLHGFSPLDVRLNLFSVKII